MGEGGRDGSRTSKGTWAVRRSSHSRTDAHDPDDAIAVLVQHAPTRHWLRLVVGCGLVRYFHLEPPPPWPASLSSLSLLSPALASPLALNRRPSRQLLVQEIGLGRIAVRFFRLRVPRQY